MEKPKKPLQIEQEFLKRPNGHNLLRRILIYDNDIAYDVAFGLKGIASIRLMSQAPDGVFYEIASKEPGKLCEHKYHLLQCRGLIYDSLGGADRGDSMVALAHYPDGTVRGGLAFPKDMSGFDVFHQKDQWSAFVLTPDGVQYVQDPDVDLGIQPKAQRVIKESPVVIIDGKETLPIARGKVVQKRPAPRSGRE